MTSSMWRFYDAPSYVLLADVALPTELRSRGTQ